MGNRAFRASLAILAVVLLVGVLSLLIVESRAVTEDYYVSHAKRMRAIETTHDDLGTVRNELQDAVEGGRGVTPVVETALARIEDNSAALLTFADMPRLSIELPARRDAFEARITEFLNDARRLIERQNVVAGALQALQNETPALVKDLREQALPEQSRQIFSLAIDIIEHTSAPTSAASAELAQRLDSLRQDSELAALLPGRLDAFAQSAETVIAGRADVSTQASAVADSPVSSALTALADDFRILNQETIDRVERARALLTLCTVLLLLAAGYAVYRLQASYRALNRSNADLERINATLEERVAARTGQLSRAYEDLKESQAQLIHAEKMSSLGEMVAGISHEINTPLWYMMSNSSVIQERLAALSELCHVVESMLAAVRSRESVNESVRRGLIDMDRLMQRGLMDDVDEARELIQDSIDGLDELTVLAKSLKDFSRLDRAHIGQFDVSDGLDKALLIAKNRIKNKAEVHRIYTVKEPILCSPSQINQVFLNLLTNAADAIEERGEIVVRTREDESSVYVSVSDTGCGIPAEVLPKIRDPFYTTKEVGRGTGLGLAIVDRIVAAHHGELRIESEPGRGTTVTVVLPKRDSKVVDLSETRVELTEPAAARSGHHDDLPEIQTA